MANLKNNNYNEGINENHSDFHVGSSTVSTTTSSSIDAAGGIKNDDMDRNIVTDKNDNETNQKNQHHFDQDQDKEQQNHHPQQQKQPQHLCWNTNNNIIDDNDGDTITTGSTNPTTTTPTATATSSCCCSTGSCSCSTQHDNKNNIYNKKSNRMNILRVSDFCTPTASRILRVCSTTCTSNNNNDTRIHYVNKYSESSPSSSSSSSSSSPSSSSSSSSLVVVSSINHSGTESVSSVHVPVQIRILRRDQDHHHHSFWNQQKPSQRNQLDCSGSFKTYNEQHQHHHHHNHHHHQTQTVYAGSIDLLYKVGIICGNWVVLTRANRSIQRPKSSSSSSSSSTIISSPPPSPPPPLSIVVRLSILPDCNVHDVTNPPNNHPADDNNNDSTEIKYKRDCNTNVLYIHPIIAVNLGWIDINDDNEYYDMDYISSHTTDHNNFQDSNPRKSNSLLPLSMQSSCFLLSKLIYNPNVINIVSMPTTSNNNNNNNNTNNNICIVPDYNNNNINDNSMVDDDVSTSPAVDVTLRIVALPPPRTGDGLLHCLHHHHHHHHDMNNNMNDHDDLSSSSVSTTSSLPLPPHGTCLQVGTLLSIQRPVVVQQQQQQQNNNKQKQQPTIPKSCHHNDLQNSSSSCYYYYYYQVVEIILQQVQNNNINNSNGVYEPTRIIYYFSSKTTRYRFVTPTPYCSVRVPPLIVLRQHQQSQQSQSYPSISSSSRIIMDNTNNKTNKRYYYHHHPDVYKFLNAFSMQQRMLTTWYRNQYPFRIPRTTTSTSSSSCSNSISDISTIISSRRRKDSSNFTMIWHVIGTNHDHHLLRTLETASHHAGRNLLVVQHGLATYAYLSDVQIQKQQQQQQQQQKQKQKQKQKQQEQRQLLRSSTRLIDEVYEKEQVQYEHPLKNEGESSNGTTTAEDSNDSSKIPRTNRTGSMLDKMDGLRIALAEAITYSPSVLVLLDSDTEFRNHRDDDDDEMERFWVILEDFFRTNQMKQQQQCMNLSSTNANSIEENIRCTVNDDHIYSYSCVPAVTIILHSTSSKTSADSRIGKFLRRNCPVSIKCTKPNHDYIQYLWVEQRQKEIHSKCDTTKLPSKFVETSVLGRSAHDIVDLFRFLLRNVDGSNATADVGDADNTDIDESDLIKLCKQYDDKKNKNNINKDSNTTNSNNSTIPCTRWEDVGGLQHVRKEIMDAIEIPLKYPHLFRSTGGDGARNLNSYTTAGILLYGPPGTGKTLVAKAVATECGLPFLSVKGPELLGSYVGESEANVRNTFLQARAMARYNEPKKACVLFFDELDSLAPRRGDSASGGNVMDRVVATFLFELDFESTCDDDNDDDDGVCTTFDYNPIVDKESVIAPMNSVQLSVFCIGATNRPDLLDPALLRPGRLDRLVYLGLSPSDYGDILTAQLRKLKLEFDVETMVDAILPHLQRNLTGADLSTIASGALLLATERLCAEADTELQQKNDAYPSARAATIDDILETWDEERLTPVVTLDDLQLAAKDVVPSVSVEELERYNLLRQKFQTSDQSPQSVISRTM